MAQTEQRPEYPATIFESEDEIEQTLNALQRYAEACRLVGLTDSGDAGEALVKTIHERLETIAEAEDSAQPLLTEDELGEVVIALEAWADINRSLGLTGQAGQWLLLSHRFRREIEARTDD